MTRLPERNLDVLRAVAVLCVFADHFLTTWDLLPQSVRWGFGRMGVLLFFVHTSLVLMSSLEREGGGRGWVRGFYIRRAFRIYPLAIVAVLGAVLIGVPGHGQPWWVMTRDPSPTAATFVANLSLTQNLVGKPDVLAVLWSLPLEVQMYVLLPGCYLIARRGLGSTLSALGAAVVGGLFVRLSGVSGMWRLSVVTFAPCFMAGVLAYVLLRRGARPRLPGWTWILVLGACAPLFAALSPDPDAPERGWLFCLGVGCAIPFVANLSESAVTRVAKVVCTYSYGIYLLHQPVLWFSFAELRGAPRALQWVICLTLLVALPALAYRLIEHPGILLGKKLASGKQTIDVHFPFGRDVHPPARDGGNREAGREAGTVAS